MWEFGVGVNALIQLNTSVNQAIQNSKLINMGSWGMSLQKL
jgi:hypothetical protein